MQRKDTKVSIRNSLNDWAEYLSANPIVIADGQEHGRRGSTIDEATIRNKLIRGGFDVDKPSSSVSGEDIVCTSYPNEVIDIKVTKFCNIPRDGSNATSSPKAITRLLTGNDASNWRNATAKLAEGGTVNNIWYIVVCKCDPSIVMIRSIKELHPGSYVWNVANLLQIDWANEYRNGPVQRSDEEFLHLMLMGLGKCFETRAQDTEYLRNYYRKH